MKKSILTQKLGLTLLAGTLMTTWACESVSLIGRDSIAEPGYEGRRDADRRVDRRDREDRNWDRVHGTVQDVDPRRREIRLRTDEGRTAVIRYDGDTRVYDGSRSLRADSLRSGEMVSIQLEKRSGGEQYAEAIRVEDRRSSW